jgi:hypothetical protein
MTEKYIPELLRKPNIQSVIELLDDGVGIIEKATNQLEDMDNESKLQWTQEPPTIEGYYWIISDSCPTDGPIVVSFLQNKSTAGHKWIYKTGDSGPYEIELDCYNCNYWWYGPIEKPELIGITK